MSSPPGKVLAGGVPWATSGGAAVLWLLMVCAAASCRKSVPQPSEPVPDAVPQAARPAGGPLLRVLFIGNSHTAAHDLPGMVRSLVRADGSGTWMESESRIDFGFLDEQVRSRATLDAIDRSNWTFVVLQSQKYSTSGRYHYSYDAAIELSRRATAHGAQVIMFPEWRRVDHPDEGRRVQRLHEEIAAITGARVAPIGLAWDRALAERPELTLHAPDGNHAAVDGAYLTACVLYTVLTGRDPRGLPNVGEARLSPEDRSFLQTVAWETVRGSLHN